MKQIQINKRQKQHNKPCNIHDPEFEVEADDKSPSRI